MPRGDGRGPEGFGSMTGRAAGYCAGFNRPGFANANVTCMKVGRRGVGRGRRIVDRSRGFGRKFYNSNVDVQFVNHEVAKENEINYLKKEKEMLENQLEVIGERISQLKDRAD
ncbi:DUF5320 domain-containing protein [Natroniella acetigena]|uniref:DUF5320 domain-containing protein n=1 Tax=Natroniella acetigena TaxID=52004 RepID=UPI00200A68B7|nr:DUF5320 domain-containing protein [Natroniella acetigena]MCK8827658.1 DUF5320 domain-containing protein [Natroniella acetigena]